MRLKKIKLIYLSVLIAVVGISNSGCSDSDETTLILAHGMHLEHPVTEAMEYMAERVEEKSDGKLIIKIYPNQQLGSERELLELVQIGTVDITKVSAANFGMFVPDFRVFELPYLFRDKAHADSVFWGEVGRQILLSGTDRFFRGLTYYDAGLRSFYTKERPVEQPSDLTGLKIRVQESAMAINFIKSLNGSPTPISYGELYTALQSGIVDGAENNPPSFYSSRHYEVTKYYSLTQHTGVPDVLLTSTFVWDKLTEQERQWLQEAADESADHQRIIWQESVKESMEEVEKAGVEVITPDREPFVKMVQPLYEQFKRQYPELFKWVGEIRNVNL
jgi:tripartite ATP-independent transporter DctP family solute receptor